MSKRAFYIWGLHSVKALLTFNPHLALEVSLRAHPDSPALDELGALSEQMGISVKRVEAKALDKLSGGANHQGVVAKRRSPISGDLKAVVTASLEQSSAPIFLALDHVQDPQNLGACLRLADAAGVAALLMTASGQAPINGAAAKIASGALDTVPIVQISNLVNGLKILAKHGVWIIGTDDAATDNYANTDMLGPVCIVMGSEGRGLRQRTREMCDFLVSIPVEGYVGSLNVTHAAAVVLFEARRQRESARDRC